MVQAPHLKPPEGISGNNPKFAPNVATKKDKNLLTSPKVVTCLVGNPYEPLLFATGISTSFLSSSEMPKRISLFQTSTIYLFWSKLHLAQVQDPIPKSPGNIAQMLRLWTIPDSLENVFSVSPICAILCDAHPQISSSCCTIPHHRR